MTPLQGQGPATGLEWLYGILPGWLLTTLVHGLVALVVLVVAWYLGKLLVRLLGRSMARRFERPSVTRLALQGIRVVVLVIAGMIAARVIGVRAGEILLSVTVFSAVLAVVLAPIVGSFISGLFILADQPFEIGDLIELVDVDTRGYVEDITLRYTKLFTLDNTFIVIPNSTIRERDIVNYSAEDERTRESLELVITYESDPQEARRAIERAARNTYGVIDGGPLIRVGNARYPARPECLIGAFGDHGITLHLRYWVDEPYRLQAIRSRVQENIWTALSETDVEMAYPHSHLVFDDTSGEVPVAVRDRRGPRSNSGHTSGPDGSDGETTAGTDESDSGSGEDTPL